MGVEGGAFPSMPWPISELQSLQDSKQKDAGEWGKTLSSKGREGWSPWAEDDKLKTNKQKNRSDMQLGGVNNH